MKPTVFIAGSSHDEKILDALEDELNAHVTIKKWIDGHKELGRDILEWAISEARQCDFGLFVLAPDSRWGQKPNGNVLLEYGLFAAALGPDRCFILQARNTAIPSDLRGRILADYGATEFKRNGAAALRRACAAIRGAIERRRKTLMDEIQGLWLERKTGVEKVEGPLSLVEFDATGATARVRGRSYDRNSAERVNFPSELNVCWVPPGRDELFHMFDARYGKTDSYSALGLSLFKFRADRRTGSGHFVVHGGGDIKKGVIEFELERITEEMLLGLGLDSAALTLDQNERCKTLIRKLQPSPTRSSRRLQPPQVIRPPTFSRRSNSVVSKRQRKVRRGV